MKNIGFPQLQVALIHMDGIIKSFPVDGEPYTSFPKIPKKQFVAQDLDFVSYM